MMDKGVIISEAFVSKESGKAIDKWPGLPAEIHAAVPMPFAPEEKDPSFVARLIVDNWFFEINLHHGSAVDKLHGPHLMQDHMYHCTDEDHKSSSFHVLGINSTKSFSDYITRFNGATRAESKHGTEPNILLYALIGVAILIVLVTMAICFWMWIQTHREKTKGFTATKQKFNYDYE
jgi:hypothetical protein